MLRSLFEWVHAMPTSVALRESLYGYTFLLTLHVVSLTLFAGIVIVLDMRLTGMAFKRVQVSHIWTRMMLPWMVLGLAVNVGSGLLLVYSQPMRYYANFYFWFKGALFVCAGLNAIYFHVTIFRTVEEWEGAPMTPLAARVAGVGSVALWAGVIITGRMLAYEGLAPDWWTALTLE
jgi:hypothetical protein